MRLWHIDLIPYLPKSQLLAQWRELNSIFKKQDKHILINYIYNYDKRPLLNYSQAVIREMLNIGYKINSFKLYNDYFNNVNSFGTERFKEHDNEYLTICYWNLREKYLRGQKDFTKEIWDNLEKFYKQKINNNQVICDYCEKPIKIFGSAICANCYCMTKKERKEKYGR